MNITDLHDSLTYLFAAQTTGFIWGDAGIGKSSVVKQYAEKKGYYFFPLYLGTQSDLGDVLGLADFKRDDKGNPIATVFATPVWLKDAIDYCNNNPESGAIIFLDEFNRARKDILSGMFSLALDKTFHTIKLPQNCHIIAAGNPPTDEYCVTDVNETALMSRFVHIKLEPTFSEWVEYAKSKEFDASLIGFLREHPDMLEDKKSSFELPVKVDRRSYERLHRLIKVGTPNSLVEQLMHGIIGLERTIAYKTYMKNLDKALTGDDILNGDGFDKVKLWSKSNNIQSAILTASCDSLVDHMINLDPKQEKFDDNQKKNLYTFFNLLPKDIAYAVIGKAVKKELKIFSEFYKDETYKKKIVSLVEDAVSKNNKETK